MLCENIWFVRWLFTLGGKYVKIITYFMQVPDLDGGSVRTVSGEEKIGKEG